MWRDPLDELIEDLEQVVKPTPAIWQVPPFELFIEIGDRIIRNTRYANSEPKDDPKIAVLIARLKAYRGGEPWPDSPSQEPRSDGSEQQTDESSQPAPEDPRGDPSTT